MPYAHANMAMQILPAIWADFSFGQTSKEEGQNPKERMKNNGRG
jgi:hypothetical protein